MKESKKIAKSIARIKYNAIELRRNHQLPTKLVLFILDLTESDDDTKVNFLKELSEHYMRVKGYYLKYPLIHDECNSQITKLYNEKYN